MSEICIPYETALPSVHLLSAGPSIRLLTDLPSGPTIAINRATYRFPTADWFVAGDIDLCAELSAAGLRPRVGISFADDSPWRDCCPAWARLVACGELQFYDWQQLPGWGIAWRRPGKAEGFSLVGAVALAIRLYPVARYDLYGHDATVQPDCQGIATGDKSEDRWRREDDELHRLLQHTERCLRRHLPSGAIQHLGL